jgi:Xaa-Pro aminopeptidase
MHKKNMTQACTEVGISRTTGYEYWKQWQETEEATYINTEWWSLYQQVKRRSPTDAFRMLTQLKLRFHPEKLEIKEDLTKKYIFSYEGLTDEQLRKLDDAAELFWEQRNRKSQSEIINIH